jgi:hypothetical protein
VHLVGSYSVLSLMMHGTMNVEIVRKECRPVLYWNLFRLPLHTYVNVTVYSMFFLLRMAQPMLFTPKPVTAIVCRLRMWHTTSRWTRSDCRANSMWQPLEPPATVFGVSVSKPVTCFTSDLFLIHLHAYVIPIISQ